MEYSALKHLTSSVQMGGTDVLIFNVLTLYELNIMLRYVILLFEHCFRVSSTMITDNVYLKASLNPQVI